MLVFVAPVMDAQRRDGKRTWEFHKERSIEPIVFKENNVLFSVLPDGSFKFKRVGKKSWKHNNKYVWKNKTLKIRRDYRGRIVRVENVPIYYKRGKIDRIGNVDFKYRRGQLKMVGDLYIVYRRGGHYLYVGTVKKQWPKNLYRNKRLS